MREEIIKPDFTSGTFLIGNTYWEVTKKERTYQFSTDYTIGKRVGNVRTELKNDIVENDFEILNLSLAITIRDCLDQLLSDYSEL